VLKTPHNVFYDGFFLKFSIMHRLPSLSKKSKQYKKNKTSDAFSMKINEKENNFHFKWIFNEPHNFLLRFTNLYKKYLAHFENGIINFHRQFDDTMN
jgi:hypothetical protein